jgi:hypothetical protein
MYKLVFFAPPSLPFLWNMRNCRCLGNYLWMGRTFSSKGYVPYIVPYPGENSLFVWVVFPAYPRQLKKRTLNLQNVQVPTRQCIFISLFVYFCINCVCVLCNHLSFWVLTLDKHQIFSLGWQWCYGPSFETVPGNSQYQKRRKFVVEISL